MVQKYLGSVSLLLVLLLSATGCLVESNVAADGSATVRVKYRLTNNELDEVRKQMQSKHVELTNAEVDSEKWATFDLKTKDITKLSTVPFFKNTEITHKDGEAGTKELRAKLSTKNPQKLNDAMLDYYGKESKVTLTLPGKILKSNASSTTEKSATWDIPTRDMYGKKETIFEVTYQVPAQAG